MPAITQEFAVSIDTEALDVALREAAANATDEHTHVALCPAGIHLRATRRWQTTCNRCEQTIRNGNVGPYTWDDEHECHKGAHNMQHGCGEWNEPTEVELLPLDIAPNTLDVYDPADPAEVAEALVAKAVDMLDSQCADEQSAAADNLQAQLARQIRETRQAIDAEGDPIGRYLAAQRRFDEADDEDMRTAAQDEMDEAASLLSLHGVAVNPDAMETGGVYLDGDTGRLAAWAPDPRSIDPDTGYAEGTIGAVEA